MSFLSGFWKPHRQENRPKTVEVGCDQAKKLIAQAVDGSISDTDRAILSKHWYSCSSCQLEMIRQRQEKEKSGQG